MTACTLGTGLFDPVHKPVRYGFLYRGNLIPEWGGQALIDAAVSEYAKADIAANLVPAYWTPEDELR